LCGRAICATVGCLGLKDPPRRGVGVGESLDYLWRTKPVLARGEVR
jgi:hypothetical protein